MAVDREVAALAETAEAIGALGGTALAHPADTGVEADGRGAMSNWRWGRSAGSTSSTPTRGSAAAMTPLLEQTVELWTEVLRVNLIGPFLAIKHAAPAMIARGRGSIVLTASVAGLRASAGGSPYSASKAGVISLAQTAANALSGTGVRVNAICPGLIETGMTKPIFDTRARTRHGRQDRPAQPAAARGRARGDRGDGAVPRQRRVLLRQRPGVRGRRRPVEHPSVHGPVALTPVQPAAAPEQSAMKTQVVVVGGGAGGLELVRKLGVELRNMDVDVVLLEQARTHIWKPLLHEVAAGSLDANMDEVGYASHGHRWNYRYFFGSLEAIDRKARQATVAPILGEDGTELFGRHRIPYDYLVIAVGSVSNDFGTPGVAEHCLFLENRIQADRFRLRLLDHCLRVSLRLRENPSADAHVDVAIVGGGATGVELAAELYNAATALEQYGLHAFDPQRMRITLIEAGPRILPALPEKLAEAAKQELEALGVRVLENTVVTEATRGAMRTASGEEIRADMLVWAAGVRGPAFVQNLDGLELTRSNQLVVSSTLQTTRDERIFAIGDCCSYTPEGAKSGGASARASRAPDGRDRAAKHRPPDPGTEAGGFRLSRPRLARLAEPLLDGRQPDGQSGGRPHGDRRAARPPGLSVALQHASDRHPRLAQRTGAYRRRPRQPGRAAETQVALGVAFGRNGHNRGRRRRIVAAVSRPRSP